MDAEKIPESKRLTVLRAIDKLDRLGIDGVRMLLGSGRKDESGDYTKGADLNATQINNVFEYLETIVRNEDFSGLEKMIALFEKSATGLHGLNELEEMTKCFQAAGYEKNQIKIDPTVIRGLEYYTGPVFEAELTFPVQDDAGRPVRFGSVGGGGRYDGLVARFRGETVPAVGFSIGVSRLLSALRAINSPIVAAAQKPGPVVVAVLDRDHMADYQRLVASLRGAGIASELYLGPGGLNAQLKYADKRGSLCAVIQGSNERDAAGGRQVVIRDLKLGAELAKASKDRADYLELRQRAQFAAPEAELVARVREVLARSGS